MPITDNATIKIRSVLRLEKEYKEILQGRLKELRAKYGYSQDVMAEKLGLKRTNIANYEAGRNVPPSHVLAQIATLFGTSVDYLLGKTENPEPLAVRDLNTISIDDLRHFNLEYKGIGLTEEEKEKVIQLLQTVLDLKK